MPHALLLWHISGIGGPSTSLVGFPSACLEEPTRAHISHAHRAHMAHTFARVFVSCCLFNQRFRCVHMPCLARALSLGHLPRPTRAHIACTTRAHRAHMGRPLVPQVKKVRQSRVVDVECDNSVHKHKSPSLHSRSLLQRYGHTYSKATLKGK